MSIPKSASRSSANRRVPTARSSRSHVLDVRVRRSTARRQRTRRITRLVLAMSLWVAVAAGTWIGYRTITQRFFLENPAYSLKHVDAELDGLMTREEAMKLTGIELGTNIFKIDLGTAEKKLSRIEQVKAAVIQRDWPDRIVIRVTKRVPVAWLARSSDGAFNADHAWLIDTDSKIIRPYRIDPEYWRLPVIFAPDTDAILNNDVLATADLQAALGLLAEHAKRADSSLEIRSVDISKGYAIEVMDSHNAHFTFAPDNPAAQLDRLDILLQNCRQTGRQIESVNLIPKKYTPVRFLLANGREPGQTEKKAEVER